MRALITIIGIILVVVIGLEIYSASNATKTETALFGIMQFILSIAIGWFLSQKNSQNEFTDKQRQFAISAYRRIKEVESTAIRLMKGLNDEIRTCKTKEDSYALNIALVRAEEILETTESSKLDWADVIGEEITKIEQLEKLKRTRTRVETEETDKRSDGESLDTSGKLVEIQQKLEAIKNSLPEQLKLLAELEDEEEDPVDEAELELAKNGYIVLRGFADDEMEFPRDVQTCEIGENLSISLEDYSDRIATLIARDSNDQRLGSFIRKFSGDYDEFTHAVCEAMGSSHFSGQIVDIDREKTNGRRSYFTVHAYPKKH